MAIKLVGDLSCSNSELGSIEDRYDLNMLPSSSLSSSWGWDEYLDDSCALRDGCLVKSGSAFDTSTLLWILGLKKIS